jgi:hypothetical protein
MEASERCSTWVGSCLVGKFLDQTGRVVKNKCSSLSGLVVSDEEKKFYNIDLWAQCYKTFYGHNLQMFGIS